MYGYRYIVRVVSTQVGTIVTWETEDGKTAGTLVVTRGHFVQIFNPLASQPMKVVCSKACLVMLYNTGAYPMLSMTHYSVTQGACFGYQQRKKLLPTF